MLDDLYYKLGLERGRVTALRLKAADFDDFDDFAIAALDLDSELRDSADFDAIRNQLNAAPTPDDAWDLFQSGVVDGIADVNPFD